MKLINFESAGLLKFDDRVFVKRNEELYSVSAKNVKVGENVYNKKGENSGYRIDVYSEYPD